MPEATSTTTAETSDDRYVTRLSLNAAALERLLGDEKGELRVDLTQAVVENLFKKHIKAIMNETSIKARLDAVESDFHKKLEEAVQARVGHWQNGDSWSTQRRFNFNAQFTSLLNTAVSEAFDKLLSEAVTEATINYTDVVQDRVDYKISKTLDALVAAGVEKRLRELSRLAKEAEVLPK